ncbi:MAG: glycosyltransferase [Saprospirales bacterium]|nr:MAG: glycosyltransferase [Saprospirales bacterium]
MQSSLSIIIPVLNEEAVLPTLLERLRKERNKSISEVIVADIGSNDRTIEITHTYDFVPLISSKFADFFRHLLWVLTRF